MGFTLIEVILVLAVAALIILIVLLTLPALMRVQRDTQRKEDLLFIVAAVRLYQSNNKGQLPPDSGQEAVTLDPDDPRNSMGTWFTGNNSASLYPYVQERLHGVTTSVAVTDQTNNRGSLYFSIDDEERFGLVWVVIGAKCPTGPIDPQLVRFNVTQSKRDVSVFRFLEGNGFACENY